MKEYSAKNNIDYDFVVMCRFDINKIFNINLYKLQKNYVYVSNIHYPRKIIPDNFIICPQYIFIKWFTIIDNISNLLNNIDLEKKISALNEKLEINAENLILANFIYYFDLDKIIYSSDIPNVI